MGHPAPETPVRDGHTLVQLTLEAEQRRSQADGEPDAAGVFVVGNSGAKATLAPSGGD